MLQTKGGRTVDQGYVIMLLPLLMLIFVWTSVTYWISARASERRMRERYALLKHLSERPADSVQLVLEQLHEDDARDEEQRRARSAVARRGKVEGAFILLAIGSMLALFFFYLAPGKPLWMIGAMPLLIGIILGLSAWHEARTGTR